MFEIDYDEKTDFPNIEPGVHNAVIHSADKRIGVDSGLPYLALRFSLVDSEINQQAWMNLSLADGALWKVRKTVTDLGLTDGEVEYDSREDFEAAVAKMLIGTEVVITVENEEFEKTLQDRVIKIESR